MHLTNEPSILRRAGGALKVASILPAVFAAECAVEAEPADGAVATASEALDGVVYASWGGTMNRGATAFEDGTPKSLDLGVGDGWTCWLAGVHGHLSEVSVVKTAGANWFLLVSAQPFQSVSGTAVCAPAMPTVEDLGVPEQHGNLIEKKLIVDPIQGDGINNFCGFRSFFTQVASDWSSSSSFATVTDNGTNPSPVAGGQNWTFTETNAHAEPECARPPDGLVKGFDSIHVVVPAHGIGTNLKQVFTQGSVCFLTNVQGSFTNNSFDDGIGLNYDFDNHAWTLVASNGKSGWATCVR